MLIEKLVEEESAQNSCEEGTWGICIKRGNLVGFLNSEYEELYDQWAVEQERERYKSMRREKWKMADLFLRKHFTRVVNGDRATGGTDYENI